MNNIHAAKSFIEDTDGVSYFFIGLGKESKLYSLYCRYNKIYWSKDALGRPIPRSDLATEHLCNLAIDYDGASDKAKSFCKEQRVLKSLIIDSKAKRQNPYDYRTPEEIATEKAEKIRYEKIKGDRWWIRRMADRHFPSWRSVMIQEAKVSKFVGEVGDKLSDLEVVCVNLTGYATQWGYTNIYTFKDEHGNFFIYRGSVDLADKWVKVRKGHRVTLDGKIKEHKRYNPKNFDVLSIKQTRLERVKIKEIKGAE